ncbi:unnamed protein product [Cercospora beticola]|nr:unnamed protein product [Cercospora beticola]
MHCSWSLSLSLLLSVSVSGVHAFRCDGGTPTRTSDCQKFVESGNWPKCPGDGSAKAACAHGWEWCGDTDVPGSAWAPGNTNGENCCLAYDNG